MKLKRLFSVIGLGLFAAVSAGAGVALSSKPKVEEAKADTNTWMVNVSFYAKDLIEHEGFDPNSLYFHTYTDGVGNDKYFQMFPLKSGSQYFSVNAAFPDGYSFNRVQFKFTETSGEKWAAPYSTTMSKGTHSSQIYCTFGSWNEGIDWTFSCNTTSNLYIEIEDQIGDDDGEYYFEEDVAHNRFIARDVYSNGGAKTYYTIYYRVSWNYAQMTLTDVDADRDNPNSNFTYVTTAWCQLKEGTYDVILKNDNSGNGILEFKKHKDTDTVYIYYVLEDNVPTNDYIYSWGGNEQFGSWPGTQIRSVVGVEEVTGNGVLHFQGSETPKLIYKIPVKTGYPIGDSQFKFNNNDTMETAARPISNHHAYWWDGDANGLAGYSIEFLIEVEAKRNAVEAHGDIKDYSVCGISKSDAESIVSTYQSLGTYMQQTYIDCTTVLTYKRDGSEGNELVTYRAVIEELAKKAEIDLSGSPRTIVGTNGGSKIESSTMIAVISVIAIISISSIIVLVVVKKRKHN